VSAAVRSPGGGREFHDLIAEVELADEIGQGTVVGIAAAIERRVATVPL
jgi:hypothetical protein